MSSFGDQIIPQKSIPVVVTMMMMMTTPIFAWFLELIPDGVTSVLPAYSSSRWEVFSDFFGVWWDVIGTYFGRSNINLIEISGSILREKRQRSVKEKSWKYQVAR